MHSGTNDQFYTRLPVNQIPLGELLSEEHLFFTVPPNWHVIITDIKGSTKAVAEGMHETINLVATGCIVAVLNIAYKQNTRIPYFFGGDGATFAVPPTILDKVMTALCLHQKNTERNYGVFLRVGQVPVETIYQQGHQLSISKHLSAEEFIIPIMLGEGLAFAEKLIKTGDQTEDFRDAGEEILDLSGMQCRWDKIKPPEQYDEVVSLVVIAGAGYKQAAVFRKVITIIDEIYGQMHQRKPISVSKLKLKATWQKIGEEMKVKMGGFRPFQVFKNWITSLLGVLYFKTKPGKIYLMQLVNFSDTLVIDGRINTVISGTSRQREALEQALNELEQRQEILFGLYVSKESVMSCYIQSMDKNHVHFVDGADGGYTMAARVLKKKLAGTE